MSNSKNIPGLVPQKDGSFALSIECPTGCVAPDILAAVTNIAKENDVKIHLTTAQKIMLLGLDQESGKRAIELLEEAGASVRKTRDLSQARTCVGKPYCPLALQDTFDLSGYLYEELARHPVIPKLKVSVAGCPACCSWANLVDLGFVGIKSGFKVLIGGHGGYIPKAGHEIGKVSNKEEAAHVMRQLATLFSENFDKKARVDKLVEKLGIDAIKEKVGLG